MQTYVGQKNKVLLYSTENYIQYLVISHNEKEYEKIPFTSLIKDLLGVSSVYSAHLCFELGML